MLCAGGAYTLWGLFPIYWRALGGVPLGLTLAHRVVWSLAAVAACLALLGRMPAFFRTLGDRRKLGVLAVSSLLIGGNWSMYIYAVYSHQVVQASLGYYITPLMNVALGVAVLRERLTRLQQAAVALAGVGVLVLGWQHGEFPWLALGMAMSFTAYGFLKKRLAVDALAGLGAETLLLAPLAALYLGWLAARSGPPTDFFPAPPAVWLLLGSGPVTLAPLLFFNAAARRLRLTTMGFIQYLSPSIQLVLAVAVFHEPFPALHWVAFGCIWTALALYSFESLAWPRSGR